MVFYINSTGGSSEPHRPSSPPTAFRRGLLHQQHWGSSEPPRSSPPLMAFQCGFIDNTGGNSELPPCPHHRWRFGVVLSIDNIRAAVNPLSHLRHRRCSGVVFLHQQHWGEQQTVSFISIAEGVPAWSSTSTAPGAATNCLARLHRRWCSGMIMFINSSGETVRPHDHMQR